MSRIAIVAFGAISALGEGAAAVSAGQIGAPARVAIARDAELASAGLARPFAARARLVGEDDRATALLERALFACGLELDRVRPSWRRQRVGLVLGTSSGGMRAAERAFAAVAKGESVHDVEGSTYFGPMARASRCLGIALDPALLVLGACASSTLAIGLASRWLERGDCDLVLAGGFDEVTVFVASGFEVLGATTARQFPNPFRLERDGMVLGEGAAVIALSHDPALVNSGGAQVAFVTGFGASSDAVHLTAPARNGDGLARAATAALREAGLSRVDVISAHGTATPFNDAAEVRAIDRALGSDHVLHTVVHPFKAQIGHTMGAAGALELLASVDAIVRGVLPAAAGKGTPDPEAFARMLGRSAAGSPATALKLSAAFGGSNAALVVSRRGDGRTRTARPAFVGRAVHVARAPPLEELSASTGRPCERLARADGLVLLALAAVARLQLVCGPLAGAGIVVGSALATVETNARFAARLREKGARYVEPRRFPYTSPNAVAGECSIAFGLTGPSFSVGGGLHAAIEALAAGALLVEGGDAERIVVVAVDEDGPATSALGGAAMGSGAIALLVSSARGVARARVGAITLRRGGAGCAPCVPGHLALFPLVCPTPPSAVSGASPPDAMGRVALEPV